MAPKGTCQMQHSRRLAQPITRQGKSPAQPCADALRHARLFEMLRQQSLAERALQRLARRRLEVGPMPIPSPAALAATLMDQSSARSF